MKRNDGIDAVIAEDGIYRDVREDMPQSLRHETVMAYRVIMPRETSETKIGRAK